MERDVQFDARVFSVDAVKKSAYRFIDRFAIDIAIHDDEIQCRLSFRSGTSDLGAEHFVDDFKKEVLDQDLRSRIKSESEAVRNLILAHAFSKTGVSGDD